MKKEEKKKENVNLGFKYLNKYSSQYRGRYILSILLALIGVGCFIVPFFAIYNISLLLIAKVTTFSSYLNWIFVIAIALLLSEVFNGLSTTVSHITTFNIIKLMRRDTCQKLVEVPMGYALSRPYGELKSIIVEKTDSVEPILAHATPELTSKIALPIGIIVYIFTIDWRMGLASLATLPLTVLFMGMMMKDYEPKYKKYSDLSKQMNSTMVEYINGINVIKTFGQSASSYKKYEDAVVDNCEYGITWMKDSIRAMSGIYAIIPSILVTILPIGTLLVIGGSLSIAEFILTIILSMGIFGPLVSAMSFVDALAQVNVALTDLYEIDNYPPMHRLDKTIEEGKVDVSIKNLCFSYDNKNKVLEDINLNIKGGTVTALVGPSGSGKSTIARLIAGFWDYNEGQILFNNIEAKNISLAALNSKVAYVSQDTFLFNTSVMENIRKGNINASDDEVIEAAKKSGCHDFIMNLEDGYNTVVGSGGGHLSGGEKQRVSIARAMLKDASIIIFDEATAYSDPENEAIVQDAISKLIENKTLIVIAHRLSTITDSDQIILVNEGKIEDSGTHQELLLSSKLYKNMYEAHIHSKDTTIEQEEVI